MAGVDTNTKLLLQMNGDRSDSQHKLTVIGSSYLTLDTNEKKFGYSSMETHNTNFMYAPSSDDFKFAGDFTIELWTKLLPTLNNNKFLITVKLASGTSTGWALKITEGKINFVNVSPLFYLYGTTDILDNVWHHIAVVRYGSDADNMKLYIDGVPEGNHTYTGTVTHSDYNFQIGGITQYPANYIPNGWIDEVRVSDIARYTSDFSSSLPAEQFESDANTLFLCHFEGNIVTDGEEGRLYSGIEINSVTSKWHGSIYFNGTGYQTIPNYAETFTGDLTIEFWENTVMAGNTIPHFFSNYRTPYANGLYCHLATGGVMTFFACSGDGSTLLYLDNQGTTVNDGLWHHIAWVRSGMGSDNCTLYIDGNAVHTGTLTGTIAFSYDFHIGAQQDYVPSRNLTGYMDEFRVSDTARWTEDFDIPTEPYSRFNYIISGDITENGKLVLLDNTSYELVGTSNVIVPTYSRAVSNTEHTVMLVPTDTSKNSETYRDITPILA